MAPSLFSQELLKVDVKPPQEKQVIVTWKDSADVLIDAVKNFASLLKLKEFLTRQDVQADTVFKPQADSLIRKIDSIMQGSNMTGIKLQRFSDTTKQETVKVVDSDGCSDLAKVQSILMKKTPEAAYEISFLDAKENPVSSFLIRQLHERLFYDKISASLLALCNEAVPGVDDSAKVKSLVDNFKKMSMYQHMLEASLEVNDDDVYAGKLTISKNLTILVIEDKKSEGQAAQPGNTPDKKKTSSIQWLNNSTEEPINSRSGNLFAVNYRLSDDAWKKLPEKIEDPGKVKKNTFFHRDTTVTHFIVHHIQIQFQDGFIENIKVRGKMQGSNHLLKFENAYPIPFSTRRDFRILQDRYIYERTIFAKSDQHTTVKLCLGDLLDYDQNLTLNCKDYSPVNHVWESDITTNETIVNLKKERTSKIMELKVFTDLKGIENDNPNGLVQLELSKRLNLWNNRRPWFRNSVNVGFFNFVNPGFSMNKIENNKKRLPLNYIGTQQIDTLSPNTYASTLSLYQHQAFRIGFDMSLLTLDIPGFKSTFNIKGGLFFGRTLTTDTLRQKIDSASFEPVKDNNIIESGVNSLQFYPELNLQIFPDKRYGISLSQKFINYKIYSRQIKQVVDSIEYAGYIHGLNGKRNGIDNYRTNRWIGATEVYAFYSPSEYNHLFFRYRYNWDLTETKVNFHQIQIGIATYLTHTSKGRKEQQQDNAVDR